MSMTIEAADLDNVIGGTGIGTARDDDELRTWMGRCRALDRKAEERQPAGRAARYRARAAQCWDDLSRTAW
jgi:hypothetical protein